MRPIDFYLRLPYGTVVAPEECSDGTQCYLARVPELPGCESHGDTPQEAVENLKEAKELYLRSMLEDGLEPPLPAEVPTTITTGVVSSSSEAGAFVAVWHVEPEDEEQPLVANVDYWTAPNAVFRGA